MNENDSQKATEDKYDTLLRFLDQEFVVINLDPKAQGVILPSYLLKDSNVSLKLSRLFRGGLEIKPEFIIANLSFNQRLFNCHIPLAAIWSATSSANETVMWPDSAPLDYLKTILDQQTTEKKSDQRRENKSAGRPVLKRIK